MLAGHSHKLLAEAASESVERIQLDRRKAPQRLKPLLAYIEENLFNPTLDVNQLKRSCGVRDNSVPIQFHSAVGRPPHGYIEDRRLETACRLLADTNLKIWQISELLGYSSIQVFSRAFSRWSGQRPTLFRKKARRGSEPERQESRPRFERRSRFDRSLVATESLRKALDGELPVEEAKTLIERLLALYPAAGEDLEVVAPAQGDDSTRDGGTSEPRPDAESVQLKGNARDQYMADSIWSRLEGQEPDRQAEILGETTVTSSALFEVLIERSRELGRHRPEEGVQIAELALASLEAIVRRAGDERQFANLQAQGWTRLANARGQAGDYRAAEQGFAEAERFLQAGGSEPEIEAEILAYRGSLRREQRRFLEAREQLDRAATLCPEGNSDLLAKILLIQASVRFEEGNPAAAIPFLEQALPYAGRTQDGQLKLALYHNLVATYSEAGLYQKAVKLLPTAKQLSIEHGTGYNRIRFGWLEGLVARGLGKVDQAEKSLLGAREAFSEKGDGFNTALVCLDIADLYSRQDRVADLIQLCASMAPVSGMLQHHREAFVALQMFQRAGEERSVTNVVVEKARRALLRSQKQATG